MTQNSAVASLDGQGGGAFTRDSMINILSTCLLKEASMLILPNDCLFHARIFIYV